jgi:hypothetical protein
MLGQKEKQEGDEEFVGTDRKRITKQMMRQEEG